LVGVPLFVPGDGPAAVLVCGAAAAVTAMLLKRLGDQASFLIRIFLGALVARALVAVLIYSFGLQGFFGGDAFTYDGVGSLLVRYWRGELNHLSYEQVLGPYMRRNWGMSYQVAVIYAVVGRNMLAVQMFNAVLGAATAPVIYLCARHIFENLRVARLAAIAVAFFPSLVLWSAQGLKDGPIVFLLAVAMYATLKLGEKLSAANLMLLIASVFALLCFRFYIFFMVVAASGGALLIGAKQVTSRSLIRQFVAVAAAGLALTYFGVLRTASSELDDYGSLEAVQRSRADLATSGSGFGKDVDVSTTQGALTAIPVGMAYLLFAPFPWQLASLRQSITLPEMLLWWTSFPLLVVGTWFTLRHRLRRALPILIFTAMLTLAYSVFQGNVGTAYRQRSQLLVFYFIFVSVGVVLAKERSEDRGRARAAAAAANAALAAAASRRPRAGDVMPGAFSRELAEPAGAGSAVAPAGGGPPLT
jgi:4-amino-4-deoxy-L-arabinose transferase-like glycosyltransferase